MLVPISWVKNYVEIPENESLKELADKLTMTGSKVEDIKVLREEISKVVVGKILSIDPHPNADKLTVCQVDIGSEIIQVVTGAGNIETGQLVPVALHGARLPGGVTFKK
ncbi:MAG: hypothetical protein GX854_08905 [Clostridiales bacterium]|nr:hypothetical protein [Clostridiales bacterium]